MQRKCFALAAGLLAGIASSAGAATQAVVTSTGSENATGVTFSATLNYDEAIQQLTVDLTNTSGFQSVITGFLFNINGDASATYSAVDDGGTAGVDESAFAEDTSFSGPFGTFEEGIFLQDLSVEQVKGIDEGETGSFVFNVSGTDASTLVALDFASEISDGAGDNDAVFLVRYQSVGENAEDSDRAFGEPGETPVIPLPAGVWGGLATLSGLGFFSRFRRKA